MSSGAKPLGWRRFWPRPATQWVYSADWATDPDSNLSDALGGAPAPPPMPTAKPVRTRWWWFWRGLAVAFALFVLLIAWLLVTAPLSQSLQPIAPPQITLLASDGTPIARSGAVVAAPVDTATLPPHVIEAFLAIEDRRFYSHWGVDPRGFARALWSNMSGSGMTQGGSTITQQLAKISFLTPERSLTRKAREMLIAFWLEARLSKDEILERYLSNAYFGDNVYGLRAASMHYFYRQPEKLKPEQAILLAGLVQAPSRYAPTRNLAAAERRAAIVRGAMVDAGFMSAAQADALPRARLDVRTRSELPAGTYFADWAMPQARELTTTSYEPLVLTTTLDAKLQKLAERVTRQGAVGNAQVALVAMRRNGEIVAMVGGRDYRKSSFNRVTQARRQPGSTFKLFVYLAALEAGYTTGDLVDDSAITAGSYRPKNSGERYRGQITLEDALVNSSNVATVRLFNDLGSEAVIKQARNLGITSPLPEGDPSMALGSSTTTLIEMTAAYAGLAGNEWPVKPHAFVTEEQGWFDWLFNGPKSYSGNVHDQMQDMLRAAVNTGTGRAARLSIANYGKTGTTQDNRDALFIGYAGDLVVGVWIGNDDNAPLRGVSGGGAPARIWRDFMQGAVPGAVPQRSAPPVVEGDETLQIELDPLGDVPLDADIGGAGLRINRNGDLTIDIGPGDDVLVPEEPRPPER